MYCSGLYSLIVVIVCEKRNWTQQLSLPMDEEDVLICSDDDARDEDQDATE